MGAVTRKPWAFIKVGKAVAYYLGNRKPVSEMSKAGKRALAEMPKRPKYLKRPVRLIN